MKETTGDSIFTAEDWQGIYACLAESDDASISLETRFERLQDALTDVIHQANALIDEPLIDQPLAKKTFRHLRIFCEIIEAIEDRFYRAYHAQFDDEVTDFNPPQAALF